MNVENIKKVRDHIASLPPERFDMNRWPGVGELRKCGTAACIGGWGAAVLFKRGGRTSVVVSRRMGLSDIQGHRLFYPMNGPRVVWEDYTTADAVRVLDHLLATGKVDWSIIAEPVVA